jgi:cyclophilin family peptidyl-prolyl cis-trans isomerase
MFLRKIIFFVLLALTFSSCLKNIKTVNLNNEYKKGVTLDTLMNLKENEQLAATIETSLGKIEIQLYAKEAPKTVKNFVGLALEGYYNGVIFHRVIKDFMIQTGDSTGTGMGGKSVYGGDFEDEFVTSLHHSTPGILSMANAGPNTNRSQFFITVAATPWLDRKHTIFGKVINGMDVVYQISNVQTARGDKPVKDIVMKNVTIDKHVF